MLSGHFFLGGCKLAKKFHEKKKKKKKKKEKKRADKLSSQPTI
jgi:hypothetical protein